MSPDQMARFPVVVTVNVDVESADARAAGETGLYGRYSYGRYGAREGMWRLLDAFAKADVPATFFVVPEDGERHPYLAEAALAAGHEVAPQSIAVASTRPTGPADLDGLADMVSRWTAMTGRAPLGWRAANGLVSREALECLASLGVVYDSSFEDDDRPYVFDGGGGRRLVELPVFQYLTDAPFYAGRHTPARTGKAWREEVSALHDAGGYLHLTLHLRGDIGSSRAVRIAVVAETLKHIAEKPDVRFYRCDELATLYRQSDTAAESIPKWSPEAARPNWPP